MIDYVTNDTGTGIYGYYNTETNEIDYIGQTSVSFKHRDNNHRYNENKWIPFDNELKNDQSKYVMIPLVYCKNQDSLNLLETFYIYKFDTIERGNKTWGGEIGMAGKKHPMYRHDIKDEDIKRLYVDEKISSEKIGALLNCSATMIRDRLEKMGIDRDKKNHRDLSGEKNPFYGKKHTKKSIEKMKKSSTKDYARVIIQKAGRGHNACGHLKYDGNDIKQSVNLALLDNLVLALNKDLWMPLFDEEDD